MMRYLLTLSLLASCLFLDAQLVTNNTMTVQQYVQDVLLGANVSVSNITFNSASANVNSTSVGGFDCTDCNLGIASGFAMSTGDVTGMQGPNGSTSYTGVGAGGFSGSDSDLLSLVQANGGSDINDWVIIEFDFVPLGDTIQFQYVWGSEEYDSWVGTGFNDVFGFFLSGPGLSGPYLNNAVNIALVPNTTTGVAINTINNGNGNAGPCTNCEYYNQLAADGDFNGTDDIYTNPFYMQFDGFTDVLTARAVVQCGQTYHIKLALCDANDSSLDSGIFLQRNSFSSNLVVQVSLNLNVAGPNGDTMFENCGDGYITFERPESGNVNTELVAYLEYTGTAVNGVDYTLLPDSVVFLPGQMSVNLYIDAFADGLSEGQESVHMEIANIAECGESLVSSSFDFFISDIAEPLVVEDVAIEMCQGETVTLEPVITGGYAVYNYTWSTGASTPTIDVTPPNSTTYFLTVSDTCGMPSDNGQFAVTVIQTPILTVSLDDQDGIIPMACNGFGTLYANANGGVLPYDYSFSDENGALWAWDNTVSVSSWNAGWIHVQIEDQCGFTAEDSIELTLTVPALFASLPDTTFVNCGENYSVVAQASGGDTQGLGYNYGWMFNGTWDWSSFTETYSSVASSPAIITVTVSDQCGQSEEASTQLIIQSPDITVSMPDSLFGTCATVHNITPILTGGSGDQNTWTYQWTVNNQIVGSAASYTSSFSDNQLIEFFVTDQCGQDASDEVQIVVENPVLSIDLGEDIQASCIDQTQLTVDTQGGSGGFQYTWLVNNQVESNFATYTVQTYETIEVMVNVDDACGESDQDTLTIFIPSEPLSIVSYPDTAVCPGNDALVGVYAAGGEMPYTMFWNAQWYGQELSVTPDATTNYQVVVTDICGRTLQESVLVEVKPITANFSIEPLGDNHYQFTANPIPACELCNTYWEFGDGAESSEWAPLHHFDGLDNYTTQLTMINEIGCTNTQTYLIMSPPYFYIPNSFTPNGDGINDVFKPQVHAAMEYEMRIFNRWGQEVFYTDDPNMAWVGQFQDGEYYNQNEAYNFTIRVKGFNSETYEHSGSILMIR